MTVAAQAVSAYLMAASMRCSMPSLQLVRALHLVGFEDGSQGGSVVAAFAAGVGSLPAWLWVQWVPQLLSGLTRPEAETCRRLLLALAASYPQAVHFMVRGFVLERKEAHQAAQQAGQAVAAQLANLAYSRAFEVFNSLHQHSVATSIDAVIEEIVGRASKLSIEEELLNYIVAYIGRASTQLLSMQKMLAQTQASGGNVAETAARQATKEAEYVRTVQAHLGRLAASKRYFFQLLA